MQSGFSKPTFLWDLLALNFGRCWLGEMKGRFRRVKKIGVPALSLWPLV